MLLFILKLYCKKQDSPNLWNKRWDEYSILQKPCASTALCLFEMFALMDVHNFMQSLYLFTKIL